MDDKILKISCNYEHNKMRSLDSYMYSITVLKINLFQIYTSTLIWNYKAIIFGETCTLRELKKCSTLES